MTQALIEQYFAPKKGYSTTFRLTRFLLAKPIANPCRIFN